MLLFSEILRLSACYGSFQFTVRILVVHRNELENKIFSDHQQIKRPARHIPPSGFPL